jgi:hypothetical protein
LGAAASAFLSLTIGLSAGLSAFLTTVGFTGFLVTTAVGPPALILYYIAYAIGSSEMSSFAAAGKVGFLPATGVLGGKTFFSSTFFSSGLATGFALLVFLASSGLFVGLVV